MNKKYKFLVLTVLSFFLVFIIAGCSSEPTPDTPEKSVSITVSAAASLTDALKEVAEEYKKENAGNEVVLNFASSGVLKRQISQGAPTDLYISASMKYMNQLEEEGLIIDTTRKNLLKNEVALIALKDSNFTGFTDLTGTEVTKVGIGAPDSVPAGRYAKEVLENLNIWQEIEPKAVFAKDVRQVLAYVESGNAEVGLVYQTDAQISDKVKIVELAPDDSHTPITYPMAIVKDTANEKVATDFLNYLLSDKAKSIFGKYGFTHIGE